MSERPRRQSASRTVTIQLKRHTLLMLPLVGLLFGAAPYAQPGGSRQRPAAPSASFRASVDVVSLNVTVSDRENRFVLDLDWPDFSVFEDGIKQDVTFFTRGRQSIALSLLIDSSASMVDHLPMLHTAATNLVHSLGPSDVAQIVDFDSRVYVRQAFTSKPAELEAAIRQTIARGSTSLYSAVYVALKELGKVRAVSEANVRRHALIVFSDGEDTSSLVAFEDVLDLAKRSETAVYAIAFRGPDTQARGFREAEYVLRTLAQETGGRAFLPGRIEDLTDIYAQIGEELASQYHHRLYLQEPDARWRLASGHRPGVAAEYESARQKRILRASDALMVAARPSSVGRAFTGRNLEFKQPACAHTRKNHTMHLSAPVKQRRQTWRQWPDVKQADDRVERIAHRRSQRLCVLMRIPPRTMRATLTVRRPHFGPVPANGESV